MHARGGVARGGLGHPSVMSYAPPPGPLPPFPPPPPPPPGAAPGTPERTSRPVDIAVTVVELLALLTVVCLMSVFSLFLGMASDGCFDDNPGCTDQVGLGVLVALLGPWVPVVAGSVLAIVRMVRGQLAWWLPWVAFVLGVGVWIGGAAIAGSATT